MLRDITKITIQQKNYPFTGEDANTYPPRNNTIIFDFVSEGEYEHSWETMTQTAKFTLPKNIY